MPTDQGGIEKTNTCGKPEWRSSLGWLGLLLLSCILFGGYCCELNRLLYQHQNPFYDSASYYTQLFKVMTLTRTEGLFAGLEQGCFYGTLCLPFIIAAVLGEWVEPSRLVGVWIQVGYLFVFEASLFYYLTRIQQLKNSTAVLGCFAFLTANCLFYDNGGPLRFPNGSRALPGVWHYRYLVSCGHGATGMVAFWLTGTGRRRLLFGPGNRSHLPGGQPAATGDGRYHFVGTTD